MGGTFEPFGRRQTVILRLVGLRTFWTPDSVILRLPLFRFYAWRGLFDRFNFGVVHSKRFAHQVAPLAYFDGGFFFADSAEHTP